jgi:hypothetical protein
MESISTNGESLDRHENLVNSKKVPPSVTKPAPKKRIDIGKIYEDDFLVLNIRLKQYGYGNALSLLKDFKDGIFPERFYKPQGALKMDENKDTNGMISLVDGKPNPDFFSHIDYQKMYEFYRNELKLSERYSRSCFNYFKYNWRIFFGDHPEELQNIFTFQKAACKKEKIIVLDDSKLEAMK